MTRYKNKKTHRKRETLSVSEVIKGTIKVQ